MSRTVGIRIEGVGFDTSKSGGAVFCDSNAVPTSSTYEWINGLVRSPGSLSIKVNPFTGEWNSPGFGFSLSRSGRIASKALATQINTPYALGADHNTSTTTITFEVAPGLSSGTVVYLGDEAVLLGTPSSNTYTGCTRGFWGTAAKTHLSGDQVYTRLPYLSRRLATIIENRDGVEVVLWQGLISRVKMVDGVIEYECESVLQVQSGQRANRAATNYVQSLKSFRDNRGRPAAQWTADGQSRVRRQTRLDSGRLRSPGVFVETFQYGERLLVCLQTDSETAPVLKIYDPISKIEVSDTDGQFLNDEPESIWRVFMIARELDTIEIDGPLFGFDTGLASETLGISATYDLYDGTTATENLPYHPLALALALLTSTGTGVNGDYDVLGENWGMGLDYIDFSSFEDEIARTPNVSIDYLLLGMDGEQVDVYDIITDKLLRPFGYSLCVAEDGSLSVMRIRLPSLIDRADSETRSLEAYPDSKVEQDLQLDKRPRSAIVETGLVPFSQTQRAKVEVLNTALRPARLTDEANVNLDYSTIDPTRLFAEGGLSEAGAALAQSLFVGLEGTPVVRFRCAHFREVGTTGYKIGNFVKIASLNIEGAWWIDDDGNEVQLDADSVQGYGLLTGVSLPFDKSYMDIEALMLAYRLGDFILLRAPSGKVSAWDSVDTITLDNDTYSSNDAAKFNAGDQLSLWSDDGTLISTLPVTIDSVDSGAGTITIIGDFGVTPAAGDIVRIDKSDVFDNDTLYSGVNRPFAYIGNSPDGSFEDSDGQTVQNFYGTEVYAGASMASIDAPDYLTIDDEAIEPEDAQSAWPIDTWLQNRLQDNESYLITREIAAGLSAHEPGQGDLTTGDSIRPFASAVGEMTVALVPMYFDQGVGRVGVRGLIRNFAYVESGTIKYADQLGVVPFLKVMVYASNGSEPPVRITGWNGNPITANSSSEQWVEFEIEALFQDPLPRGFQGYIMLTVYAPFISASAGEDVFQTEVANVVADGDGCAMRSGIATTLLPDTSTTPRPAFDDQALVGFRALSSAPASTDEGFFDNYLDPLSNEALFGGGNQIFVGGNSYTSSTIIGKYQLLGSQFRGLEFFIKSFDTSLRPQGAIEALRPVLGEDCAPHALRVDTAHRKRVLLTVGPYYDRRGTPLSFPGGYENRWERTDITSARGIEQDVYVMPRGENPKFRVSALVLPTFCAKTLDVDPPENIHDADQIIFGKWSAVGIAYRYSGGAPVEVGRGRIDDINIRHWYTYLRSKNVLTSEWAVYAGLFAFKEGSMYVEDRQYLFPIELEIQTADCPADEPLYIDFTIFATTVGGAPQFSIDGSNYTAERDTNNRKRIRLALAGLAVQQEV